MLCCQSDKNNMTQIIFDYNTFGKTQWTSTHIVFCKFVYGENGSRFFQQDGATVPTANKSVAALCNGLH
jgi:hypothetical protein